MRRSAARKPPVHLGERHRRARGGWLEKAFAPCGSGSQGARKPLAVDALFSLGLRRLDELLFLALLSLANLDEGADQELVFRDWTVGHAPLFLPDEDIIETVALEWGPMGDVVETVTFLPALCS